MLKAKNVITDTADGGEEFGIGGLVGGGEGGGGDADRIGGEIGFVDALGIIEGGGKAAGADVVADALDDLLGSEGLAEDFDGALAAGFADDVAARTEALAEVGQELADVGLAGVDAEEFEGVGHGRMKAVCGVYLEGVGIDKRRFYGHLSRGWVQWRTSLRA